MPILQLPDYQGSRITINARRESTVLMVNADTTFTFDYEGRLIGAFLDGRNYRRSLANEILEKAPGPRPGLSGRLRRLLPSAEVQALETRAYDLAHALSRQLEAGPAPSGEWIQPGGGGGPDAWLKEVHEALGRVRSYTYARLERERQAFAQLYRPVSILPPDQYLALYLQATEGCSHNACTFCGLYRDRRFRVKSPEEFRAHIRAVRTFFGGAMSLRRTIFLGDANALLLPTDRLVPMFQALQAEFAILPRGLQGEARRAWEASYPLHMQGIYSFIDAFATWRKTTPDFRILSELGLRRVYIGLETGHGGLLFFLGKPNTPRDVLHVVQHVKAGGIAVGVIILVGAGGDKYQEDHIRSTAQVINDMPLDADDLIYFSELVDYPGSSYSRRAQEAGIRPLTPTEIEHQMVRLRAGLCFRNPQSAPKVSFYDLREFVY